MERMKSAENFIKYIMKRKVNIRLKKKNPKQ